jgi:hypothetical protein
MNLTVIIRLSCTGISAQGPLPFPLLSKSCIHISDAVVCMQVSMDAHFGAAAGAFPLITPTFFLGSFLSSSGVSLIPLSEPSSSSSSSSSSSCQL